MFIFIDDFCSLEQSEMACELLPGCFAKDTS